LDKLSFNIRDVQIELLINESTNIIDKVKISLNEEGEDAYFSEHEDINYLSNFYNNIIFRAGTTTQNFLDSFSKQINKKDFQIFNGEDFTTIYGFESTPPIMISSSNESNRYLYINDNEVNYTVKFYTKGDNIIDHVYYLLKDAQHSLELGKYEISLITMGIMFELLVTLHLAKFTDNSCFNEIHQDNTEEIYVNKPSFVPRYFKYGLTLITSKELNMDTLDAVDFIYKVRDKLTHGEELYDIQLIKESGITEYNIRDIWQRLIYYSNEVCDYFYRL